MAIPFKLLQKKTPLSDTKALFYAQTISTGPIDMKEMVEIISKKTRVPYLDCLKVFLTFEETVKKQLSEGRIVHMGDLGSFRATLSSQGSKTPKSFNLSHIKSVNVKFKPAKEFKKYMNEEVTFKKIV